MIDTAQPRCIAFLGTRKLATGSLIDVATAAKAAIDGGEDAALQVFDADTSETIELDLRGSMADVIARLGRPAPTRSAHRAGGRARLGGDAAAKESPPRRSPGRPKLGVVAREVTLLPRHWDWLNAQPGGASVTLRKLVEQARRASSGDRDRRRAQESAYRFAIAIAGDAPGYEEAMRVLFAGDRAAFETHTSAWPADVRDHARHLADSAFTDTPPAGDD